MLVFGSVVNGLYQKGLESDLDLTLIVPDFEKPHEELLQVTKSVLEKGLRKDPSLGVKVKEAPPPFLMSGGALLEMKLSCNGEDINVDILVNKTLEICNSKLINTYCLTD